jgi:hypothetical protein
MTAPPDRVWIVVMDGFGGGMWYDSLRIVPVAAHLEAHEYIPLDGTTMQAAIAAAEARGLDLAIERVTAFLSRTDDDAHTLAVDAMLEDMQNANHDAEIRLYRDVIRAPKENPDE